MDTTQILTPRARQGIERAITHRDECQARLERAEADLVAALQDGWNVRKGTTVYVSGVPHIVTHVIPWSDDGPDQRPLLLGYRVGGDANHFNPLGRDWRTSVEMDGPRDSWGLPVGAKATVPPPQKSGLPRGKGAQPFGGQ